MVDKTRGFVAGMFLEIALGAGSPIPMVRVCDATGISGIGKTNAEVDDTTFCSGGNREYIPGLAEGSQVTIDMRYVISSAARRALMTAVNNRETVQAQLVVNPNNDPTADEVYQFDLAMLGWTITPSLDGKNVGQFTARISGNIDYVDNYPNPT